MADLLKPEDRATGFGLVGAAFGAGFVIGPLIGGLAGSFDPRLPFLIAAGLSLANAAIGFFFLEETLPPEKREGAEIRIANPIRTLVGLFKLPGMAPLAIALLLAATIQRGLESVWVLFTGAQYGWSVRDAGISLAVVGLSFILVQGMLVRPVVKRFGERTTMIAGLSMSALVYVLLAFNVNGIIGYVGIIPHVLGWGLATPALQAIASRKVAADQQGALQGGLSAVQGLSAILGPVFSNGMFSYFMSSAAAFQFPGAFFLAGSAVLMASVVIASRTAN
jgi:DHA1 family tetracycline resistance protein-like MFS transporter